MDRFNVLETGKQRFASLKENPLRECWVECRCLWIKVKVIGGSVFHYAVLEMGICPIAFL